MINWIDIKNFRSIQESRLDFSPLTVIVGANGSGKSNLVKALEFISMIPRSGIQNSVNHMGGFLGIIPKHFPSSLSERVSPRCI